MRGRGWWVAAALMAALLVASAPVFCSQASDAPRPRCDTALGYWTPVSEAGEGVLLLVLVALIVVALTNRRRS